MALNFINPTDYKTTISSFIERMKRKNDYLKEWAAQPATKSPKTPGEKIFHPDIFKGDENKMDLSHYTKILSSNLLSEQERKFYLLQKFMLELADADYKQVSDINTLFTLNAGHIKELLLKKKNGKANKLIFLVPNIGLDKSNFWLSLFFIELTKSILSPDYYINDTSLLNSSLSGPSYFSSEFNYIVVITDDISYSGSQISGNTFGGRTIDNKFTLFFNLVGYSDVALARINKEKTNSGSTCKLEFARGAKFPLNKLSAKFKDLAAVQNNVLYQKSLLDFVSPAPKVGTRMLSSLLLNDVFYLEKSFGYGSHNINFVSNLFNYYQYWESATKDKDNNGSIQYLPIKYPDSYSTIENMCKFYRLQNVAILRIDRLIHYLNLPGRTDEEKLDFISQLIIDKNLYFDKQGHSITISFELIHKFIEKSQGINVSPNWPILLNSFDNKFINIFTIGGILGPSNNMLNNMVTTFNKTFNNNNYNNQILHKFVNLNNKISKFNKKHMLEFVMPKSEYLLKHSSKYTIKNCGDKVYRYEPYDTTKYYYCNLTCSLNFYKKIKWN